jgi:hypothetical protein
MRMRTTDPFYVIRRSEAGDTDKGESEYAYEYLRVGSADRNSDIHQSNFPKGPPLRGSSQNPDREVREAG